MKSTPILILCFVLGLLACNPAHKAFFEETPSNYVENLQQPDLLRGLKTYREGYYYFQLCVKDTVMYGESMNWFCHCNEPQVVDTLETLCILFIDEARALYFKNPDDYFAKNPRKIYLDKIPDKQFKLATYRVMASSRGGNPELSLRVRPPKVQNEDQEFADLKFELRPDGNLHLMEMAYFDYDTALKKLKKKEKELIDPRDINYELTKDPEAGLKRIDPDEAFTIKKLNYAFNPKPFVIFYNDKSIDQIVLEPLGNNFSRKYKSNNEFLLQEDLRTPNSIKTW